MASANLVPDLYESNISEVEERILSLWSTGGASWFRLEVIAAEVGVYVDALLPALLDMSGRGLLRQITLTLKSGSHDRWMISPAGLALNEYFRGLYEQTPPRERRGCLCG